MSTATIGRDAEYKVRNDLIAHGYPYIMRAAASKGAGDLLHGHPVHGAFLVQVGTINKYLLPAERERFCQAAELIRGTPLVAIRFVNPGHPTVTRYWVVTRDQARHWHEWTP